MKSNFRLQKMYPKNLKIFSQSNRKSIQWETTRLIRLGKEMTRKDVLLSENNIN